MNEIIAQNTKHIIEIIIDSCQWNYNGISKNKEYISLSKYLLITVYAY